MNNEQLNWADVVETDIVETDVIETNVSKQDYEKFDDMNLHENILRGIYSYGFENPSVIQQRAIVPITKGHDVIAQAQSGTGKTGTFVIGISQRVYSECDTNDKYPLVIILTPTRELAYQINQVVVNLNVHTGLKSIICVGGIPVRDNISQLHRGGIHIIIGTPGRIIDLMDRNALKTTSLKIICFDEADEMLSKGFQDNVRKIFQGIPSTVQVLLLSATLPPECLELTKKFMNNPLEILVKKEQLTLEGIKQFYVDCQEDRYKFDVICELYESFNIQQAVIFCNSKKRVEWLSNKLNEENFSVTKIHGGIPALERVNTMHEFRTGSTRVLVSTDLLARGIDVQQISIVINYDLPRDRENYLHRIGRSGRFGRKGIAVNFITKRDLSYMKHLEKYYDTFMEPLPENFDEFL